MLGDVLRLSWSMSLGSLLPSSLRLRPSRLSRSEGDWGRGSSCCTRGRAMVAFAFPASPGFGALLAQNNFPSTAHHCTTTGRVLLLKPTAWPSGDPPLSQSLCCSLAGIRVPSGQTQFLPQASISSISSHSTAEPKSVSSTSPSAILSSHPPF